MTGRGTQVQRRASTRLSRSMQRGQARACSLKRTSLSEYAISVPAGAGVLSGGMIWLLMMMLFSEGCIYMYDLI
jgi:hypothetical protein